MRTTSLRRRLLLVGAAGLLPLAVASGFALLALVNHQKQQTVQSGIEITRALSIAVDGELQRTVASLEALAADPRLAAGDLSRHREVLERAVAARRDWTEIIVHDTRGRMVMNTSIPAGAALPMTVEPVSLQQLIGTLKPVIGTLRLGVMGTYRFPVRVPVLERGSLRYVLTAVVDPAAFVELLNRQRLPDDWVASIFDAAGARVARSSRHGQFLGQEASPSLKELMQRGAREGTGITYTLEGNRGYTAYTRLPVTEWSIAVTSPTAVIEGALVHSLVVYGGGVLLSIALGIAAAVLVARRIVGPMSALRSDRMNRRTFFGSAAIAVALENYQRQTASAAELKVAGPAPPEPIVWPVVTTPQPGSPSFTGHTDTVPDIVGRIGTPPSLVIFTEGNHLMVVLSDDIVGAFPAWAKAQPQYADLHLDNIVVVTLPQPVCIQMIRTGAVALGNLTLDVSRGSGFYPDIFMGYPEPLRQLRQLGVIEPHARFFCKNRGVALMVRSGNPLGVQGLADVTRISARIALPDSGDVRAQCWAAAGALLTKSGADALFAAEALSFPGRLGIMHRDLPEMVARGYADVAFTWYHLVSYWRRIFPNYFELVPVPGAEPFFARIAFSRVSNPLRPRAVKAFDEFFFSRAKDVYPRYDFARMDDNEYAAHLALDELVHQGHD